MGASIAIQHAKPVPGPGVHKHLADQCSSRLPATAKQLANPAVVSAAPKLGSLLPSAGHNDITAADFKSFLKNIQNPHGAMLVSRGKSRIQGLVSEWNQVDSNTPKITTYAPTISKEYKHVSQIFYTFEVDGKPAVLSEVIIPADQAEHELLSDAFSYHMAASAENFKAHKTKLGTEQQNEWAKSLDESMVEIVGAEWKDSLPKPIQQNTPLGCALGAANNFMMIQGVDKLLEPQDYAKYLQQQKNMQLTFGLFIPEILQVMANGENYTLNKNDFINSFVPPIDNDEATNSANSSKNPGLYNLVVNNSNNRISLEELWANLVAKAYPQDPNSKNIISFTLTPETWYAAQGAMDYSQLAKLLDFAQDDNQEPTIPFKIKTINKNQHSFEAEIIGEFQQFNLRNDQEIPAKPAFIALEGEKGDGVNNHFVCLFLENDRWYILDSAKKYSIPACPQNKLVDYLLNNNMANVVYPTNPKTKAD